MRRPPEPAPPLPAARLPVEGPPPGASQRSLLDAFRYAWAGLLHTAVKQRNMKIHIVAGVMVGLVGSGIPLGLAEKVTLIFCVMLVLFAEILNAALEALVDLYTERFHQLAQVAKDTAAGGVLVLAIGTVVIFLALIVHNWPLVLASGPQILRQVLLGGPLTILTGLLLWSRRRNPLVDHVLFVLGTGLLAMLASVTSSVVFTTLSAALFALARVVARANERPGAAPR